MVSKLLLAIALVVIIVQLSSATSISPHFKRRFRNNKSPQLVGPKASGNRFAAQRPRNMPYAASRFSASHQAKGNSAKGMERNKYSLMNDARKRTHPAAGVNYGNNPYNSRMPSQFYPHPPQGAPNMQQGPVAPWMNMQSLPQTPAMMPQGPQPQPQGLFNPPGRPAYPDMRPNAEPNYPYSQV